MKCPNCMNGKMKEKEEFKNYLICQNNLCNYSMTKPYFYDEIIETEKILDEYTQITCERRMMENQLKIMKFLEEWKK